MKIRSPAGSADLGIPARVLRASALLALAGYVGSLLLGPPGPQLWRECGLQGVVLTLIATFSVLVTVRSGQDRARRVPLAVWMVLFAIGNLVQNAHAGRSPARWQDVLALVLFMLCYPMAITAVLLSHRGRWQVRSVGTLLDALVPALAVIALFVAAILPSALRGLAAHGVGALYVILLPVLDVTAQILLVVTLALTGRRPERISGWLFLGMAIFASADSRWAIALAEGAWLTGTPWDAVWVVGCAAVGLGAVGAPVNGNTRVWGVATLAVPLLGAVGALVLVLIGTQLPVPDLALGLAAAAILGALLRLVHAYSQVLTLDETRRLAHTDALTGLGNRRGLQHAVDEAIGAVPFRPFAVVLADLNDFKKVNDEYGHGVGDELLEMVTERLLRALPAEAVLTRLGGDEFAAVLPLGADDRAADPATPGWPDGLTALVRSAAEQVSAEWLCAGARFCVGASFGIAVSRTRDEGLRDLLHRADVAMYLAKRSGGTVHVHRPEDGLSDGARPDRRPDPAGRLTG